MQHHRINTISQLQAEQERLKEHMRLVREGLQDSARRTTIGSRDFVLKKVLLPAGAIGLGVVVAKQFFGDSLDADEKPHLGHADDNWVARLMSSGIPFAKEQLLRMGVDTDSNEIKDWEKRLSAALSQGPAGLFAMIFPMALPMIQAFLARKSEGNSKVHDGEQLGGTPVKKAWLPNLLSTLLKLLPVVLPLAMQFLKPRQEAAANRHSEQFQES
jgi:hypothetical protein